MTQLTVNVWLRRIALSRLSSSAKLVAHTIGLRMDWTKLECHPGVERIARESGLSGRTVQRATRELQRAGFLWVEFRGKRPRNLPNLYRARVPEASPDAPDDWSTEVPF